jgi:hypothetical protein
MHCLAKRPKKNKKNIFELLLIQLLFVIFVWGASPGSAGCFKNATQTPNAGHRLSWKKKSKKKF